jgi:hypothetical protein
MMGHLHLRERGAPLTTGGASMPMHEGHAGHEFVPSGERPSHETGAGG